MATINVSSKGLFYNHSGTLPITSNDGYFCWWQKSIDPTLGTVLTNRRIFINFYGTDTDIRFRVVLNEQSNDAMMTLSVNDTAGAGTTSNFLGNNFIDPDLGWSFIEIQKTGTIWTCSVNRTIIGAVNSSGEAGGFDLTGIAIGMLRSNDQRFPAMSEMVNVLLLEGTPTTQERNTLFGYGIPPQNLPTFSTATVFAYWPLHSSPNDTSGNVRNLTWGGTPAYGTAAINDLISPNLTVRTGTDWFAESISGTSSYIIDLVSDETKDWRIGLEAPLSSDTQNIVINTPEAALTIALDDDQLDHDEGQTVFEQILPVLATTEPVSRKRVWSKLTYTSNVVNRAILRWGKAVVNANQAWGSPLDVKIGDRIYHFGRQAGSGRVVAWADDVDPVSLDTTSFNLPSGQNDDKHHSVSAILFSTELGDSSDYVFVSWNRSHNGSAMYGRRIPFTGNMLDFSSMSSQFTLASTGDYTYGVAKKIGANSLWVSCRGDGLGTEKPSILKITNAHATPSITQVLPSEFDPIYPGDLEIFEGADGRKVAAIVLQPRTGDKQQTLGLRALTIDVANGSPYSPNGTLGEVTSPHFSIAETDQAYGDGGLSIVPAPLNDRTQRYMCGGFIPVGSSWTALSPKLSGLFLYIETDQTGADNSNLAVTAGRWEDMYAPAYLKAVMLQANGTIEEVSLPNAVTNAPGNSYRMEAQLIPVDGINDYWALIPERGRDYAPVSLARVDGKYEGQYSDWGFDTLRIYRVTNSNWTYRGQIERTGDYRLFQPRLVEGTNDVIAVTEGIGRAGWAWMHGKVMTLSLSDLPDVEEDIENYSVIYSTGSKLLLQELETYYTFAFTTSTTNQEDIAFNGFQMKINKTDIGNRFVILNELDSYDEEAEMFIGGQPITIRRIGNSWYFVQSNETNLNFVSIVYKGLYFKVYQNQGKGFIKQS